MNEDVADFDALSTTLQSDATEDLDDFAENNWENEPEKLAQWHRAEKLGRAIRNPDNATPVAKAAA